MLFDVHVHTTHSSCSALAIEEILLNARSRGVDGVCITDHNTMNVRNDIVEGIQDDGLCVIIGMEYDTPDGDFLLFGPIEDLRPGLDAEEVLHIVSERGGVSIAAHPFRQDRPVAESVMQKGLCRVIEGINGRNSEFENAKTYIEKNVAEGSRVDAVWETSIGNMGRIIYVFEVQTKGSIDGLILNLLKSMNNPAVQGVVAVSDKEQLEKIKKHAENVGDLSKKLRYWDYEEVLQNHEALELVNESINRLGLVPDFF